MKTNKLAMTAYITHPLTSCWRQSRYMRSGEDVMIVREVDSNNVVCAVPGFFDRLVRLHPSMLDLP